MDNFDDFGVGPVSYKTSRKKRSNMNRRPQDELDSSEYHDLVSIPSTPSDHVSDATNEGSVRSVNRYVSSESFSNLVDAETLPTKSSDDDGLFGEPSEAKKSLEENLSDNSWRNVKMKNNKTSGVGNENKFNKVKLKVGGVTRTICTRSNSSDSSVAGTFSTISAPSEAICCPHKPNRQEDNVDVGNSGLRGVPWKDFLKTGFSFGKADSSEESIKKSSKHGRLHKSKSRFKKHFDDEVYDEEDDDDEIKYLQKLKASKISIYENSRYGDKNRVKKMRKISKVMGHVDRYTSVTGDYGSSRSGEQSMRSKSKKFSEDTDYLEEESVSDDDMNPKNKKQRKEYTDALDYPKKESSITTRRRAVLSRQEISPVSVEFPDGLPPVPPKKPKEQLTEVEKQLKKAEAAERRRIQHEKATRESEAEAIRKILGQDSSRKRREEKIKKRREEIAQERNANQATIASNVVRLVMGPSGTVVTFPNEIGLPSIFRTEPSRYPPPREKCAGPSCTNAYKYRDSESKVPLCSLQCYRAIHDKTKPVVSSC